MRILNAEMRKVITRRFVLLLAAAVLINVFLFHRNLNSKYRDFTPEQYARLCRDVAAMDEEERIEFVVSRRNMLNACQRWDIYYRNSGFSIKITDAMLEYKEIYEKGGYLIYGNNAFEEYQMFKILYNQLQMVQEYQDGLDTTIAEAEKKTSISIFAKPGTFPYRNQLAVLERFREAKNVTPIFDVSDGVLNMQSSAVTDLLALLVILFLCTQMVVAEHKNGMLPILRTTKNGRLRLISTKIITTVVLAFLVSVVLWGSNLIYTASTFGLGEFSRPLQSLAGYQACTVLISVGEYLLLFFLSKWLLYLFVGLFCLAAGLLFRSAMPTWLSAGIFLGVGYLLSSSIAPISAWNYLKYINIGNCIFDTDWISTYRNLNIFGYPVQVLTVSMALMVLLPLITVGFLLFLFCKRKVRVMPKLKNPFRLPKWFPRLGKTLLIFRHEHWKLLIECGVLLLVPLFLLTCLQEPKYVSYSVEDLYYSAYMEKLAGPLTEEKRAYLESEAARFEGLREDLRQISKDAAEGKISEDELKLLQEPIQRALKAEEVLNQNVYPKIQRIEKLAESGETAWLVYEPGYEYLFGKTSEEEKAGSAVLLMAAVVFCFCNFYPLETTTGMLPLLNTYGRGRGATASRKIALGMLYTVLLYAMAQIPNYRYVFANYGFPTLEAPLCSLEMFSGWKYSVSVLGGILIYEGLRLLTTLSLMMVILLISVWSRNQVVTLSASGGFLLLPLLLHVLDVQFLDRFSFYYPLTGTKLVSDAEPLRSCLTYYGGSYLWGMISTVLLLVYVGTGYRFPKIPRRSKNTAN